MLADLKQLDNIAIMNEEIKDIGSKYTNLMGEEFQSCIAVKPKTRITLRLQYIGK